MLVRLQEKRQNEEGGSGTRQTGRDLLLPALWCLACVSSGQSCPASALSQLLIFKSLASPDLISIIIWNFGIHQMDFLNYCSIEKT